MGKLFYRISKSFWLRSRAFGVYGGFSYNAEGCVFFADVNTNHTAQNVNHQLFGHSIFGAWGGAAETESGNYRDGRGDSHDDRAVKGIYCGSCAGR